MARRPPRTSYGYLAPPDARVKGWECRDDGCGTGDQPAPPSWPHPCRLCGRPTDPTFEEPWAHDARIHLIRHQLRSPDRYERERARIEQHVWAYKEACFQGDAAAAAAAWQAFRANRPARWQESDTWWIASTALYEMVSLSAVFDDLEPAADELMECYPHVDTRDVEDDNTRRTISRTFVSMCVEWLKSEAAIDHPREAEIYGAMRDVAARIESVLMDHHHRGFQELAEKRAMHRSRAGMAAVRRSAGVAFDGLPPVAWPARGAAQDLARVDAAIAAAETHDDLGPLDDLVRRLGDPALVHLARARRHVVTGDLDAALGELDAGAQRGGRVLPQTLATAGLLLARRDPADLDRAIAWCRTGRAAGLRWWRRTTAADASLARLLLWRALRSEAAPAGGLAEAREAERLMRRRCRPWRGPDADDRLLLQEALAAREALTGRPSDERRHQAWRASVDGPWSAPEKARLAVAWAEWAVGTRVAEFAAEAYQHLVTLATQDAVARQGAAAKQRVLASAQEYAEEAGYWLARTGRYREAAIALETGRAVNLTEVLGRAASGAEFSVGYDEIAAETDDGALVYLAAAKAGGYALVVAGRHDPQYVDLPKLDRATVAGIVGRVQPEAVGVVRLATHREIAPAGPPAVQPMAAALRTMWHAGIGEILLFFARGDVVTLVPVGLFSLLPLHAVGDPGMPGDERAEGRHAGRFSAIRYAPNARTLRRCREALAGDGAGTLLAIDVPKGSGVDSPLRYVARETAEITRRWTGGSAQPIHDCTWAEFRAAADAHTSWHVACHGATEPASILDSRLYFADRQVTLAELLRTLRPGRRRLAVLSACQTNLSGSAMPNEAVGLPSALIQLGFAGVIATAWAVDDLATTYLMTVFYHAWCQEGREPVVALNLAQQWLRGARHADLLALLPDVTPAGGPGEFPYADPIYWAAFAYTGA
ncbi:CHAT domain-containing protein [Asanoa siamensis]|uniref:CHAT domain-containing protein n=1 Tax=Asanoa siamensis TaxID=926357 RepID=A0ABQ4D2U6_9ACTN|nr:CHAT domain-containing protein [Asanoa siamensis]GIF77862.1 hypothetical protein Asi02nite_73800 [Asanoa siamensis]